jgi:F420H(2)-dependent quinone reductase
MRCLAATHRFWYRVTGGRVGGRFGRARILLLTTQGRRSGRERTTPLTYLEDDGRFVVIGSNAGRDRHPDWYLNLQADPKAVVQAGGKRFPVVAETAGPEDTERLWSEFIRIFGGYAGYRRRTSREIPIVFLTAQEAG